MKLSDLGEFGLIERIAAGGVTSPDRLVQGIGDDCAVIRGPRGRLSLVTTDMLVEHVHFTRQAIGPRQLGAKALAVNLSDIAAMGGRPLDACVAVAIPPDVDSCYVEALYDGIKQLAGVSGVNIVGGDTNRSARDLVISVTLTGEVAPEHVLYRSGARPGDRIYVSGTLGDAAAGLDAITTGRAEADPDGRELARRHREPVPHLEAAAAIAATGLAHAMIDVSDGLAADLGHICRASGVGCRLAGGKLQRAVSAPLESYCRAHGLDPVRLALGGGEDYVLLVTGLPELGETLAARGLALVELGEITKEKERWLVARDGARGSLDAPGWDHFHRPAE